MFSDFLIYDLYALLPARARHEAVETVGTKDFVYAPP